MAVERRVTPDELAKFLEWVRKGEGLHKAARRLGVPYKAVEVAREAFPEFDEAVRLAEVEAAEPVETVLYQAALRGEPWAVTKWLEQRSKERWSQKTETSVTVKVEHEVGPRLARIGELRAELEKRRAAVGQVIDVGHSLSVPALPSPTGTPPE